jgi:hypothetical protein
MKRIIGMIVLAAAVRASGSGFPSLLMGADARTAAMANAGTAWPGDGASGFRNPALTAWPEARGAVISAHRWMQDVRSGFFAISAPGEKTGFGGHLLFTEIPDIEYRTGPSEDPLGTFSANEAVAGLDFGRRLSPRWSVGLGGRVYYEKIFVDDAWGFGADAGAAYRFPGYPVRIGAVVQNVGATSKLSTERIRLPLTFRLGAAAPFRLAGGDGLLLLDAVKERDSDLGFAAGAEVAWKGLLFLRAGYRGGVSTLGASAGVGLAVGDTRFDYAFTPLKRGLGDSHRLSVVWAF